MLGTVQFDTQNDSEDQPCTRNHDQNAGASGNSHFPGFDFMYKLLVELVVVEGQRIEIPEVPRVGRVRRRTVRSSQVGLSYR